MRVLTEDESAVITVTCPNPIIIPFLEIQEEKDNPIFIIKSTVEVGFFIPIYCFP